MSYFEFPHTRNYEGDLGFVIKSIIELTQKYDDFMQYNQIKFNDPITWNITTQYAPWRIVFDVASQAFYIAKKPVPRGIEISNTDYWNLITPFKVDMSLDNSSINPIANKPVADKFDLVDANIVEFNSTLSGALSAIDTLNSGLILDLYQQTSLQKQVSEHHPTSLSMQELIILSHWNRDPLPVTPNSQTFAWRLMVVYSPQPVMP